VIQITDLLQNSITVAATPKPPKLWAEDYYPII